MEEKSVLISGRKQVKVQLVSIARVFMFACVSGACAIALGVAFNSLILSVGAPVVIMAAYIYKTLERQSDLPISVIGDSFYYLGFILTLVALVTSLVALAADASVNMNNVVGSFGAALITTIIGLVARLVVTSFSVQAKERREHLENEIERSLTSFSEHLDSLTTGVVASITKVHAGTETALNETIKRYDSVQHELLEQYKTSMTLAEKSVQESMENLSVRIDSIEVTPDLLSKPLIQSIEEISNVLSDHQRSYAEVNSKLSASNIALSGQFDQSSSLIQSHVDRLESSLAKAVERQANQYEKRLNDIGGVVLKSFSDLKELKLETQDGIKTKLATLEANIDSLSVGIRKVILPIEHSSQEVVNGSQHVAEGLNKLANASTKIGDLMDSTRTATSQVSDMQSDFENLTSTIKDMCIQLQGVTDASRNAALTISNAAQATENSSVQVASDITEVYKQLAVQIRALRGVV